MKVQIRGIEAEIDINDDDALFAACDALAAASVKRIEPNNHTKALKQLIQGLHYWTLKNGAQIAGAYMGGYDGIGMESSLSSHNFVCSLIGEPPLVLPEAEPAGPNEALEGEEGAPLVDAQGRPIPPGQLDLGDEL